MATDDDDDGEDDGDDTIGIEFVFRMEKLKCLTFWLQTNFCEANCEKKKKIIFKCVSEWF